MAVLILYSNTCFAILYAWLLCLELEQCERNCENENRITIHSEIVN